MSPKFYKDYTTVEEPIRCLGVEPLSEVPAGRKLGSEGITEETLTAPITLNKGANLKTYNFSRKRPCAVRTMINRIGRED